LSSQAEALRASIAYFRIDGKDAGQAHAPAPKPMHAPRANGRPPMRSPAPKAQRKPTVTKGKLPISASARGNGVALDLTMGGPDDDDAQFKAYS
jgi:methyl-accepting chemotaxis protein